MLSDGYRSDHLSTSCVNFRNPKASVGSGYRQTDRSRLLRWVFPAHLAHATTLRGVGQNVTEMVSTQSTLQTPALLAESTASTRASPDDEVNTSA